MVQRTCLVSGCGASHVLARGWCSTHYMRWYRHGDPLANPKHVVVQSDGTTTCSACEKALPAESFYVDGSKPTGLSSRCRECVKAAACKRYKADPAAAQRVAHIYYQNNKPGYIARAEAWRKAHPEYGREQSRRYAARKKGAAIGRVTPDLIAAKFAYWGNRCWMCGGPAVEPDHVKPLAKGGPHMLANLRPACVPCNRSKQDRWPYPLARASARPACR